VNDYVWLPVSLLQNKTGGSAFIVLRRQSDAITVTQYPYFISRSTAGGIGSMRQALNINPGANAGAGSYAHQYRRNDVDATGQMPIIRRTTAWDYVVLVNDYANNLVYFYLNGLEVGSAALTGSGNSDNTVSVGAWLGCSNDNAGARSNFFAGQIAGFGYIDRAWTGQEVVSVHSHIQSTFAL
jgi:hypothetical protein